RARAPRTTPALSSGRGWTAPRAFTSGRGTGEGSFPNARDPARNLIPELSNLDCLPGRAGGSSNGLEFQPSPPWARGWTAACVFTIGGGPGIGARITVGGAP